MTKGGHGDRTGIRWLFPAACLLVAILVVCGCETTMKVTEEIMEPPPGAEFVPGTFVSTIRFDKGGNPDLFSPESFAVWLGSDVDAAKLSKLRESGKSVDVSLQNAAAQIHENFLVFECDVSSVMADMSIAYDVVGFRGMDIYLETSDGRKIKPFQMVIGSPVHEEPRGAIKRFGRENIVAFQKRDFLAKGPTVSANAPRVRLVLEGFDSRFYFEWTPAVEPATPWTATAEEYAQAVKTDFVRIYGRLLELAHITQ